MSLEKNLKKLSDLAEIVENDSTTLEDSLKAFEQSVELAEKCLSELKGFEGKLEIINNKIQELKND